MTLVVRPAKAEDAKNMCILLNEIIAAGGSTAHQQLFDEYRMETHYLGPLRLVSCMVADACGDLLGFQSLIWAEHDSNSQVSQQTGWAYIASFVSRQRHGQGVGQSMFAATRTAARNAGVVAIDATIRADNKAGLAYYSGLVFTDYDVLRDVPLGDGTKVDRVRKSLFL